jgi:uncharacterized protein YozE (UPF0346 family)
MTFRKWITGQQKRRDAISSLARDVAFDTDARKIRNTRQAWREYLETQGAPDNVLEVFEAAWVEYEQSSKPENVFVAKSGG